jgi:hypothetical protein
MRSKSSAYPADPRYVLLARIALDDKAAHAGCRRLFMVANPRLLTTQIVFTSAF